MGLEVNSNKYWRTSFSCGTCGGAIDFRRRIGTRPGAWYVHADTHRFRCGPWWSRRTNTRTTDFEFELMIR